MQKWQKSRNYRRVKDESGNVVANIITVDGVDVEVTEEVFLAYSQMDRRERYLDEQQEEHPQVSLELLTAHDVPIDLYATQHEISAEESAIEPYCLVYRGKSAQRLPYIKSALLWRLVR